MTISDAGNYVVPTGGTSIDNLLFDPNVGTSVISGGKLSVSQGINNQSNSQQHIQNQVTLTGNNTWQSVGVTHFSGYISGNHSLTVNGNINISSQINSPSLTFVGGNSVVANAQMTGPLSINNSASVEFTQFLTGTSIHVNTTGNVVFSGKVNSGVLTITSGDVTITGTESKNFTQTFVDGGTLYLDQETGYAINGPLTITGGSVIFNGDNQLPEWSSLTLGDGAYVNLNGTTQSIAHLNITGNSIIDFGDTAAMDVLWGGISFSGSGTLLIRNWVDDLDRFTAFVNPGSQQLPRIIFEGWGEAGWTSDGGFINPTAPVPEPSFVGAFMLGFAVIWAGLRRKNHAKMR